MGLEEVVRGDRDDEWNWRDATDVLNGEEPPPPDFLVDNFIERQSRTILVGPEGCGKSLLALHLGVQVAIGVPVMERFGVKAEAKVVYFDLEMGERQSRRRLYQATLPAKRKAQIEEFPHGALEVVNRIEGLDLNSKKERADLMGRIEKAQPELLIFDPLYKMTTTDSLYERDVRPTIRFLDECRANLDCAILLVHHLRKQSGIGPERGSNSSDVFGSSVLLRWPETILMMTAYTMKVAKDRDGIFGDGAVYDVRRGGEWLISLGMPKDELEHQCYEQIAVHGPLSKNGIAKKIGRRQTDVRDAVKRLAGRGMVVEEEKGWVTSDTLTGRS